MTTIIEDGAITISKADITDSPYTSQHVLKILLEKGAPILGMCHLTMDSRYRWFLTDSKRRSSTLYRWEFKTE